MNTEPKASSPNLDLVFKALSVPIRRRILEELAFGEKKVSELALEFEVSAPAISRHIRLLSEAGLLSKRSDGAVHWCRLQTEPILEAMAWMRFHSNLISQASQESSG